MKGFLIGIFLVLILGFGVFGYIQPSNDDVIKDDQQSTVTQS